MKDFLGQDLKIGDYIVLQGAGNRSAEYGLLLYQIIGFGDRTVQAERLSVSYIWYNPDGNRRKTAKVVVEKKKGILKKRSKLVKVNPPQGMIKVFQNPQEYAELVGKWVHGQTEIDWQAIKTLGRYDD